MRERKERLKNNDGEERRRERKRNGEERGRERERRVEKERWRRKWERSSCAFIVEKNDKEEKKIEPTK